MLLTNSKQIIIPKIDQTSTFELHLSDFQTAEDDNQSCSKASFNELGPFNELQRRLREMQNSIFEESTQIFKLLNESNTIMVDGLTYQEIQQSSELCNTLHLIRENSPIYQHLNNRKKSLLMNRIAHKFMQQLNKNDCFYYQKQAPSHKNQSQNQSEKVNFSSAVDINKNSCIKTKIVKKTIKFAKNCDQTLKTNKKVHFSTISSCKYFCSQQPSKRIKRKKVNSFKTF